MKMIYNNTLILRERNVMLMKNDQPRRLRDDRIARGEDVDGEDFAAAEILIGHQNEK